MATSVGQNHQGDEFVGCSFAGAVIRESDLTGARLVGSWVDGLRVDSFAGELQGPVYVDGVDVTGYVTARLDELFPERVLVRQAETADQFRAAWTAVRSSWEGTVARARELSTVDLNASVDGEWSFLQTLRHLIFAVDTWVGHMLEDPPGPWHRWGQPFLGFAREDATSIGLDLEATPSLTEIAEVLRGRWARLATQVDAATDASLTEIRAAQADPERFLTETRAHCLGVILNEHAEHRRYAERDLDMLEHLNLKVQR